MQCPPPFNEKSTWEAYHTQISLLAELNGWKEQQKAAYIAISLSTISDRADEPCSRTAQRLHCIVCRLAELLWKHSPSGAKLSTTMWKEQRETLPEVVEDIEQLTQFAYPNSAEQLVVLAKDQFIDALTKILG